MIFFAKKGTIFGGGGVPPVVAPEGDLVFRGKPSHPFNFYFMMRSTIVQPIGVLGM
jgi:hypothetical protein